MSLEPASSMSIRVQTCAACGAELAPTLLACPSCRRLVHTDRLKALAEAAEAAERDDNPSLALASWQEVITLLPRGTRQYPRDRRANRQAGTPGGIEPGALPRCQASFGRPNHYARRRPKRIGLVERCRVRGCRHARPGSLEIQIPGVHGAEQGQAALARLDQGQHISLDVRHGRGLLDGVRVLVCAGAGAVDLHP